MCIRDSSIAAIIWLFTPFIAYLFLSLLICISTYSSFNKLSNKYSKNLAAVIMTLLVTVLLIMPLGYILLVSGIEITALINKLQSDYQVSEISRITDQIIMGLPISCLLYTSPSPRDGLLSRMPSSA